MQKSWANIVAPARLQPIPAQPQPPFPPVVKRDWEQLEANIKECKITLPIKKGGKTRGYKPVKIRHNDILYALHDKKSHWIAGTEFEAYTGIDMSVRYRFYVISFDGKTLIADQSFLHYDGTNFVPKNTREVMVVLY
jgi:hypothetical protein